MTRPHPFTLQHFFLRFSKYTLILSFVLYINVRSKSGWETRLQVSETWANGVPKSWVKNSTWRIHFYSDLDPEHFEFSLFLLWHQNALAKVGLKSMEVKVVDSGRVTPTDRDNSTFQHTNARSRKKKVRVGVGGKSDVARLKFWGGGGELLWLQTEKFAKIMCQKTVENEIGKFWTGTER